MRLNLGPVEVSKVQLPKVTEAKALAVLSNTTKDIHIISVYLAHYNYSSMAGTRWWQSFLCHRIRLRFDILPRVILDAILIYCVTFLSLDEASEHNETIAVEYTRMHVARQR